jgi:serum/glucocorticoid-regulated kinase 3
VTSVVQYLAPEVLQKLPYTRSIDWWCLGAVTYEMVYGLPPFYSRNTDEMYQGILYKPLRLNSSVSLDMRDFLTLMLQKNPKHRLGHTEDDWEQVRAHKFFREINFDHLLSKKIRPAFIPNVSGPTDGRYIEAAFRNSPIPPSVDQDGTGKIGSDNPFEGFTFQQSAPMSYSLRDHRNANLDNFTDFH